MHVFSFGHDGHSGRYGAAVNDGEGPDAEALAKIAAAVDAITLETDRAAGVHAPPPWEPWD